MSTTTLKRIALAAMVINYVGALIPGAPIWFQWIGRLAAPLFFFCMAWSMDKTHDMKAYFRRLYLCSVGMALFNLLISIVTKLAGLSTMVTSNMFATLFATAFFIHLLEYGRKHPRRRMRIWLIYAFWQIAFAGLWAVLEDAIRIRTAERGDIALYNAEQER